MHVRQWHPRDLQYAGPVCRQPVPSGLRHAQRQLCAITNGIFNDDDKFLGATDFNKIHQPGNGPGDDASLQREETANTFLRALGVPWLYKRLVAVYVNGNRRGTLMEDTQVPAGDMVKEYFPNDTDGFLYKMQPWFEFAPFPTGSTIAFNMNELVHAQLLHHHRRGEEGGALSLQL